MAGTIAVVLEKADVPWGTLSNLIRVEKGMREMKFQSAPASVQVDKVIFWF